MMKKLLVFGLVLFVLGVAGTMVSAYRTIELRESVSPAEISHFRERAVLVAIAADLTPAVTPIYTPWPTETPILQSPPTSLTPVAESQVRLAPPALVPVPTPSRELPLARRRIEAEWPSEMQLARTYYIRVSVAQRNPERVRSPTAPGISRAIATIPPASTPQVLLAQAAAAGYEPESNCKSDWQRLHD